MADADLAVDEDQDSPAGTTVKENHVGEGGDEDGDGEEVEEEDAMGEAEDEDLAVPGPDNIVSLKNGAIVASKVPPTQTSNLRPSKDDHPPLSSARSPEPGWVKLEDEYAREDAAKRASAAVATS